MKDGAGNDPTPSLEEIWPGPLPEDQRAIWAAMPQKHRQAAARRLGMIRSYEDAGSRDAAAHVDTREISLPRFHAILRAWRQERSLYSLVPRARRRATRRFDPPEGVEEAARELVRRKTALSREQIALALQDRFGRPSLSWMRRLVARTARDLEREVTGGRSGFGRRIVLDSAALPLPLLPEPSDVDPAVGEVAAAANGEVESEDVAWAVAAFAWDAATGRILGYEVSRVPASMALHALAAASAADHLRTMDAPTTGVMEPVIATTLPLKHRDAVETLRLSVRLERDGAEVIHSSRTAGAELMKTFSGRLRTLDLRPRYAGETFTGRISRRDALARSGRLPMTIAEARLVVDHAIGVSNEMDPAADPAPAIRPTLVADKLDRIFLPYLTTPLPR